MAFCFSRISYLSFGIKIAKRKRQSLGNRVFLTDNKARWTIDRVYRFNTSFLRFWAFLGEDIRRL